MKKNSLLPPSLAIALGCSSFVARAAEQDEPPDYRPVTLSLEGGTTGLGAGVAWRFMDHWGARAGVDVYRYTDSSYSIADIQYGSRIQLLSEPLTLDFYPWVKYSFRISAGMMFNQNSLTGETGDTGTIIIDGHPFPVETTGTLHLKVEQQLVNPYLSIGGNFFYFDRALAAEAKSVKNYAEKFMWWPVAKLTVSYAF
jgi:hypothetical protein